MAKLLEGSVIKKATGDKVIATTDQIPTNTSQLTNNSGFVTSSHTHDDRYYTESEVNTLLAAKADSTTLSGHTGNATVHVTQTDKDNWNGKLGSDNAVINDSLNVFTSSGSSTNQVGSGIASASTTYSGYPSSNAFDGNLTTGWGNNSAMPSWLQYDFGGGNEKAINLYRIYFANTITGFNSYDYSPDTWQFQGSNDGTNWTNLDSRSGQGWSANEWKDYTFDNVTPYRYYRLYVTNAKTSAVWLVVPEMQLCIDTGSIPTLNVEEGQVKANGYNVWHGGNSPIVTNTTQPTNSAEIWYKVVG